MMLDANHNSGWESFFCNRHVMIYYSEDVTDIKTELGEKTTVKKTSLLQFFWRN